MFHTYACNFSHAHPPILSPTPIPPPLPVSPATQTCNGAAMKTASLYVSAGGGGKVMIFQSNIAEIGPSKCLCECLNV